MKPLAVVVLNWNGMAILPEFLPHWLANTETEQSELIIVDNGSTDESCAYIKKLYPELRLIEFTENYGYAGGYNKALELLPHPYALLLNSDATPLSPNELTAPLKLLNENPQVAAIQPKIKAYKQRSNFEYAGAAGGRIDFLGYPYCEGRVLGLVEEDRGQYENIKEIDWASGAGLFVRRELFLKNGGFDDRFFAHQEEIDLCLRLRARGYKLLYCPQATIYHLGGASLDMNNPKKSYLNYRNNLLMLYKNLGTFAFAWRLIIRLGLDFTLAFVQLLQGKQAHSSAIFRAYRDFLKQKASFAQKKKENFAQQVSPKPRLLSKSFLLFEYLKLRF